METPERYPVFRRGFFKIKFCTFPAIVFQYPDTCYDEKMIWHRLWWKVWIGYRKHKYVVNFRKFVEAVDLYAPDVFIGRWFLSNKKTIPMDVFLHWAKKYPYHGTAFRVDGKKSCLSRPMSSWSKTSEGVHEWLLHQSPYGLMPHNSCLYKAEINGLDLVAMVVGEKMRDDIATQLITKVQEVSPTEPVKNIIRF